MANFAQDIQTFQRYGTYIYNFDNVGNMIFNSSSANFSQVYVAFPLQNVFYDASKIESFYNPNFIEFQMSSSTGVVDVISIQDQLDAVQAENLALKVQLDTILSAEIISDESGNVEATKRLILELRKALGEGQIDSDFSEIYPYAPLKANIS